MLLFFLLKLLFTNPAGFVIALIVLVFPLLVSITVHEWSHGMVAYLFGDPTPKRQGRLTFNPFAHLDPVGTLMLFIIGIGWAKPVQINPANIHGKGKQMLVAFAGPLSNFILAVIASFILYLIAQTANISISSSEIMAPSAQFDLPHLIIFFLSFIIQINLLLGIFNMLPIPPLDGSNVVKWLLPENVGDAYYSKIAPFGLIILLLILFAGGFKYIIALAQTFEMYILQAVKYILSPIFGE